jgi:AcrR family transcriptional regulator
MARLKPNARARLIEAMIATAARYGYREASVARVIAQAGVSRATFYQHFEDKEACFLAAYREVAQRILSEMQLVEEELGDAGAPREILARLLKSADRDPAATRVALLESLAGGETVRAEHGQLVNAVEQLVDVYLSEVAEGPALEIPARCVLGGIGSVIAIRVFRGETGRLVELLDDLEAWLRAYALPSGQRRRDCAGWEALRLNMGGPVKPAPNPLEVGLPRGRAALPPSMVAGEHRQRILAAVGRVAREKGYAAMTVADVVATAGIAREAFYEHFRSKEDAFLTAQAVSLENSVSMAASKFFGEEPWSERVWTAALPMLGYISSVPDLAALDFIESYTAGNAAIRRSFESRMAFTLFLEEGYRQRPEAEVLPRLSSEAIAGGILELMRRETVEGRIELIKGLTPQAVYVALAPFVGPEEAMDQVEARLASA